MRHRAGLGGRDVTCIADGEDVVVLLREQGLLVHRDVVQVVAQPGAGDHVRAHVEGDGHQEIEGDLPLVVGDQGLGLGIDPLDHEVRLQQDLAVVQHVPEVLARHRLGEGRPRSGVT